MRKPVVLITGANGEIGHALVANLVQQRNQGVVSLDVNALDPHVARLVHREFTGSILDTNLLERILSEFEVDLIFHLAALLSTRSEFTPMAAHHVNVEGTLNLLEFAAHETESHGRPVVFVYPSSIAAYGLPDLETRRKAGRVREDDWNKPITMYGCNKLYCEHLGRYYSKHYKQLLEAQAPRVDFRCVRFPGLISAVTRALGRHLRLRVGDDSRGCARRAVRVLRAARYADSVHGDARRDRRASEAVDRAAEPAVVVGVQRARVQSVGRRDSRLGAARVSRRAASPIQSMPSARPSSIRGPRTSTTRRRAATGTSRRPTTSIARSTST